MQTRDLGLIAFSFFGLTVWAAEPTTTVTGIENFHQVDQFVYRGAQPTDDGFRNLSTLGVKVVIDLREHDQRAVAEERTVTGDGMRYVNVPMSGMTPPTEVQIKQILALMEDQAEGPVFVHCKRGADRTGAVIAAYRIDHDKWENSKALSEAMTHKMSHLQFQRQQYIREFQPVLMATTPVDTAIVSSAPAVKN